MPIDDARTIYRKVGRRYEPLGTEWTGFPSDGIWLVEDGRQSLIMKVGDLPDPLTLAALQRYQSEACQELMEIHREWQQKPLSPVEIINRIFMAMAEAEADETSRYQYMKRKRRIQEKWVEFEVDGFGPNGEKFKGTVELQFKGPHPGMMRMKEIHQIDSKDATVPIDEKKRYYYNPPDEGICLVCPSCGNLWPLKKGDRLVLKEDGQSLKCPDCSNSSLIKNWIQEKSE